MKIEINLLLLLLTSQLYATLYITEVERNPYGLETAIPGGKSHEFIECANIGFDTLILDSLVLTDGVVEQSLRSIDSKAALLPGQILLIMDPDYFSAPENSLYTIPENVLTAVVDGPSICGGLTDTDGFALLYGVNREMLSIFSTSHSLDGFNSGKIHFEDKECLDEDTTSIHLSSIVSEKYKSCSPTPGVFNFLGKGGYYESNVAKKGDSGTVRVSIYQWRPSPLKISLHTGNRLEWRQEVEFFDSLDSKVSFPIEPGEYYLSYTTASDTLIDTLYISALFPEENALKISEVAPRASVEWVELHNSGSRSIALEGYGVVRSGDTLILEGGVIQTQEYAVLSSHNEFFGEMAYIRLNKRLTLDNYRDTLLLLSPFGAIDTFSWDYKTFPHWDKESINRVGETDVLCSPSPGISSHCSDKNSLSLTVYPTIVTPNGDGIDDLLHINIGPQYGVEYRCLIYSLSGELLFSQTVSEPDTIQWNGVDRYGRISSRGPIIIVLEAEGEVVRTEAILWP